MTIWVGEPPWSQWVLVAAKNLRFAALVPFPGPPCRVSSSTGVALTATTSVTVAMSDRMETILNVVRVDCVKDCNV